MRNHEISDKKTEIFYFKILTFSRFRIFCGMRNTISNGQRKFWGHLVKFFCYLAKCVKN